MSKKLLLVLLCITMLAFFAYGCSEEVVDDGDDNDVVLDDPINLKVNTVGGPTQAQVAGLYAASEYIRERSNGQIIIEVYHSGVLGPAGTAIPDVQEGLYDIGMTSPTWNEEFYGPQGALEAPFILRDYDHMMAVLESETGQEITKGFEDATNLKILDHWYFGHRHVMSTKKALTPDEFGDHAFRVPPAPMFIDTAEIIYASNPTPLPLGELYLAFSTGTIDTSFAPINMIYETSLHEVINYVIKTGDVVYSLQPFINMDTWNSIPAHLQEVILEGFAVGRTVNNSITFEAEANFEEMFINDFGIEIYEPDLDPFLETAKQLHEKYLDVWGEGLIEKIRAIK